MFSALVQNKDWPTINEINMGNKVSYKDLLQTPFISETRLLVTFTKIAMLLKQVLMSSIHVRKMASSGYIVPQGKSLVRNVRCARKMHITLKLNFETFYT